MSHLGERIAEYVFGDMPVQEMADAKRHLADCADCRQQVDAFQHTHAMLAVLPDVDPPHRIVFEVEKPRFAGWASRWLVPAGAAIAASLLTAILMTPDVPPAPQIVERVAPSLPVAQPSAQPVDYDRLTSEMSSELRASIQLWLQAELEKRDAANRLEIRRVRGDLAYVENVQRAMDRDLLETASAIQFAQRSPSED